MNHDDEFVADGFVVPAALAGDRVDRAVAFHTGWSRSDVQTLIDQGDVTIDGATVAKSRRLAEGETVEINAAPAAEGVPGPEAIPLDVEYCDDDVIVVHKPAGIVVHPGSGVTSGTLVNALLHAYPEIADVGDPQRPGIVHRLDRDTSGLLVVARSERAYESLVEQLSMRSVERRYVALCWGLPASPRGVIDAAIGRSQTRRTRMAVRDDGRDARTWYEVRDHWRRPGVSLLECRLETGRTHQIRVHLNAIGHPVVGDATYGGYRESIALRRPFLHARFLGFEHPADGRVLRFERPITADLQTVLDDLGAPDERSEPASR
jgi:23S rRNA pseudouridine1911/1915/1917 synthase